MQGKLLKGKRQWWEELDPQKLMVQSIKKTNQLKGFTLISSLKKNFSSRQNGSE
jgi:hypothetical protein